MNDIQNKYRSYVRTGGIDIFNTPLGNKLYINQSWFSLSENEKNYVLSKSNGTSGNLPKNEYEYLGEEDNGLSKNYVFERIKLQHESKLDT